MSYDLIDRKQLIQEIKSLRITLGGKDIFPANVRETVLRIILEQPVPWIRAEDGLPRDPEECVLALASGKYENVELRDAVQLAYYDAEDGWLLEEFPEWQNPEVSQWMHIPATDEELEALENERT